MLELALWGLYICFFVVLKERKVGGVSAELSAHWLP